MNAFFSIQNLSFAFDSETKQLFFKNVSCSFKKNSIHFIRGKNGAGKSTFFRLLRGKVEGREKINGLITIGTKTLDFHDQQQRSELAQYIRLAPQKFDEMLADNFTFPQNLQLARLPRYPGLDRFVENTIIPPLVDRFGIDYNVPAGMLSGGQRQILSILMAIQKPTSILLLDEPTATLDEKNAAVVMAFLHDLVAAQPELTVLIICHDKDLVDAYAQERYYQIEVAADGSRTLHSIAITSS